jgi:hypothetical protein
VVDAHLDMGLRSHHIYIYIGYIGYIGNAIGVPDILRSGFAMKFRGESNGTVPGPSNHKKTWTPGVGGMGVALDNFIC